MVVVVLKNIKVIEANYGGFLYQVCPGGVMGGVHRTVCGICEIFSHHEERKYTNPGNS